MLAGKKMKYMPYKKVNAIDETIYNKQLTGGSPYNGILEDYYYYRNQGYIVTGTTSESISFLNTATTGKHLVIFKGFLPSSSNTLTVASSSITRHEDVIIMGMEVDSYFSIINHSFPLTFLVTGDQTGLLKFKYLNLTLSSNASTGQNFRIENCDIQPDATFEFTNLGLKNTNYYVSSGNINTRKILYSSTNYSIENCLFNSNLLSSTDSIPPSFGNYQLILSLSTNTDLNIKNCEFKNNPVNFQQVSSSGGTGNFIIDNVFLNKSYYSYNQTYNSPMYFYNYEAKTGSASVINWLIPKNVNENINNINFGLPSINWDLVDFDNFEDVDADYKTEYVIDNSQFFNTGTRVNYSQTFLNNNPIPDTVKKFSQDQYTFVQREDIETDIASSSGVKSIQNFTLYDTSSAASEFSYSNDENFLIKAYRVSSTADIAVIEYYNNQLYPTVFSDVWDNEPYNIEHVFQMWEIDSITDLKQTIRDKETKQGITNSPLQGTIRYQNLDSEILEEI